MIRADSMSPDVWEAMCTPMHEILSPSGMLESLLLFFLIDIVLPGRSGALYLGSWAASVDNELLANNRIRAIVEVHDSPWGSTPLPTPSTPGRALSSYGFEEARSDGRSVTAPGQMGRYKIAIADSSASDILKPHLDGAVRFIKDRLAGGENVQDLRAEVEVEVETEVEDRESRMMRQFTIHLVHLHYQSGPHRITHHRAH